MTAKPARKTKDDRPPPGPGDPQPGETAVAYEAFRTYLEQGQGRSTARVGRALGKSKALMDRWSARWRWVQRVKEFDGRAASVRDEAYTDELARRGRVQAEISARHGDLTDRIAGLAMDRLKALTDEELEALDTLDLLRVAVMAARAHGRTVVTERLARGMTSDAGEPLPRSEAEERAARLDEAELDRRLAPVDEVGAKRTEKAKR